MTLSKILLYNYRILGIACLFLWIACTDLDPQRVHSPYYHNGRFHNLDADDEIVKGNLFLILKWKLSRFFSSPEVLADKNPPAVTQLKPEELLAPLGKVRLVWLGHATVWIAVNKNGKRFHIITDPVFANLFFGFIKRLTPLPIQPEELPKIDAVLVSHAHPDHLDMDSLELIQKLNPDAQFLLPAGAMVLAQKKGLKTHCKEWWQTVSLNEYKIRYVPAQHHSRLGFNDFLQIHWGGYVLELGKHHIFFAGDTAYASHIEKIGQRYPKGFSIALLPIGGYKPRWIMKHVHIGPHEALQITQELGANLMLPIHWGTFFFSSDFPQEPALLLERLIREKKIQMQRVQVWHPGKYIDI